MRIPAIVLIFFLLLAGMAACIDEVALPVRSETPKLVVDGLITNQPGSTTVRLSFTGTAVGARTLREAGAVREAEVLVTDNLGNEVRLDEVQPGQYQPSDSIFTGVTGRSYTLSIRLPDGRHYISRPEQLLPVPDIERVYYEVKDQERLTENAGINVYVDVNDPAGTRNYYRWSAYGYSFRPSTGKCCDFIVPGCGRCFLQCWMRSDNLAANLLSDDLINGNPIRRQFVYFSPIRMRGPHLIEVSQYSLTENAYRFWQRYEEQRTRTGSILDPLPKPIEGNVFNAADSTEVALGYFGASSVFRQRIKTDPFAIDANRVLYYEQIYRREGDCRVAWPGSEYDAARPDVWLDK